MEAEKRKSVVCKQLPAPSVHNPLVPGSNPGWPTSFLISVIALFSAIIPRLAISLSVLAVGFEGIAGSSRINVIYKRQLREDLPWLVFVRSAGLSCLRIPGFAKFVALQLATRLRQRHPPRQFPP